MFVSIFYTSHLGVAEFFWGTKWVGHNLFMFMKRTPTWTFTNSNLNLHQLQPEPSPTPTWTFTNSNLNLHPAFLRGISPPGPPKRCPSSFVFKLCCVGAGHVEEWRSIDNDVWRRHRCCRLPYWRSYPDPKVCPLMGNLYKNRPMLRGYLWVK